MVRLSAMKKIYNQFHAKCDDPDITIHEIVFVSIICYSTYLYDIYVFNKGFGIIENYDMIPSALNVVIK